MKLLTVRNVMNNVVRMCFVIVAISTMAACGDDSSSSSYNPNDYYWDNSIGQCRSYKNGDLVDPSRCDYNSSYYNNYNNQYQAYGQYQFNGVVELDFGLNYNDRCQPGYTPVYQYINGVRRLTRCDYTGGGYTDFTYFNHHNISNCAGGYAGDQRCIPM